MVANYHYLLSALPHLGELGDPPPMSSAEMLERVAEAGGPTRLVAAVLLSDDLLQRDAVQAGEVDQAAPAVLTSAQLADQEPLPEYLSDAGPQVPGAVAADAVWAAYFRHAEGVARSAHSEFLSAWVGYEVALRNALAAVRAKALQLDVEPYLVAADLADADADLTSVVHEWSAAATPLAGHRAVDSARWAWLGEHEAWFSFGADELAVYAARLVLLHRWHRLAQSRSRGQTAQTP